MAINKIIIANSGIKKFDPRTARALWSSHKEGIQEIMAMKDGKYAVVAYAFPEKGFTVKSANEWIRNKKVSVNELFASKRVRPVSSCVLCASKPSLPLGKEGIVKADKDTNFAALNDKYFLHVDGVHSGINKNDIVFTKEELSKSYLSAGYQLFDWEHLQDQIIGVSLDSELFTDSDDVMALSINAILHRLSPFMQMEERVEDKLIKRDDLIKQRYFEDRLAVSMECFFDKMRCTECQFETDDWIEMEFHIFLNHGAILDAGGRVGKELIGIDFMGWGIVEFPADSEAYVSSLRTSDDGTIQEIVSDENKDQFGELSASVSFGSHIMAQTDYNDTFEAKNGNFIFASEKKVKKVQNKSTKTEVVIDNSTVSDKNIGGIHMLFNLKVKTAKCKDLSEIFVVAQNTLREFKGDSPLQAEASKAFATELSETVESFISKESFAVDNVFTVTDAEKLEAMNSVRVEEQVKNEEFSQKNTELTEEIVKLTESKDQLAVQAEDSKKKFDEISAKLEEANQKVSDFELAEAKAKEEAEVKIHFDELSAAGVEVDGLLETEVKKMISERLGKEEDLKTLKTELVASFKQKVLADASGITTVGSTGKTGDGSFTDKMNKAKDNN